MAPAVLAVLGGDQHLGELLPPVIAACVYLGLYLKRAGTLRRRGKPVEGWRIGSFCSGVVMMAIVQIGVFDQVADEHLLAHMIQHIVIGDVATLFVVLGLTGPVMQPVLSLPTAKFIRPLMHPVAALLLWALDLYVWHVPLFYQQAIIHDLIHALEHACLFWFGFILWMALLGPLPKPWWFTNWARLGYVLVVRFAGSVLANILIWVQTEFYPYYHRTDVHSGLNPISDQNIAGAIMMVEQIVLTTALLAWLLLRAFRQDDAKQELLDLAEDQGVALTEDRAGRAAAMGESATERLRERLVAAGSAGESIEVDDGPPARDG